MNRGESFLSGRLKPISDLLCSLFLSFFLQALSERAIQRYRRKSLASIHNPPACVFTSRKERGKERVRERKKSHNTGTNLERATRGERAFFLAALSFLSNLRRGGRRRRTGREWWTKKKTKRVHVPGIRGLSSIQDSVCDSRGLALAEATCSLRISFLPFLSSGSPRETLRRSSVIPHRFSRASRGVEMSSPSRSGGSHYSSLHGHS